MKRLLITTDSFLPRWDGVARFLSDLIPVLSEEYHITVVAPLFPGPEPVIKGVEIFRIPIIKKQISDIYFAWPPFRRMKELVKRSDIVFNQTLGPIGFTAIRAAKKLKKPVVSFVHSIEWELTSKSVKRGKRIVFHGIKRYARRLYNKCTSLMVPTKEVRHILAKEGIRTRKNVVQVGVNIGKFTPPEDKRQAKQAIGLTPSNTVIGFCGRIAREKNLITLKRAFQLLRKKHPGLVLLIVGEGPKDQVDELRGDNIILTGPQNNIVPFLQAMDIYVLPSLTETTSISTLEAMAAGLPVVSTPVGFVKEYIEKGWNGFFFPKQSIDGLRIRLEELLADDDLLDYMGRNARKTIIHKHRWSVSVKEIKKDLREVLINLDF